MKTLPLLALLFALSPPSPSLASARETLRARVTQALPKKVAALVPGKSTRADVKRALGDPLPDSKPEEAYYSTAGGDSSDLTVGFEKDRVRYVLYDLADSEREKLTISELRELIPKTALEEARKTRQESMKLPDAGQEIQIRVPSLPC